MQANVTTRRRRRYRSLFWPFVLIGVGVIWLLANFDLIPIENLSILAQLWPVLLIAIGLDMIFSRFSPILGALIGTVTIVAVIGLLIAGPTIGLQPTGRFFGIPVVSYSNAQLQTEHFAEPVGDAKDAQVRLYLSSPRSTIFALSDSPNLIDATIVHYGDTQFHTEGTQSKVITLSAGNVIQTGMNPANWNKARWDIGLSPQVPLELTVDGGSGGADVDLSGLTLRALNVDGGSGGIDLRLPAGTEQYTGRIESGSARMTITVADGAVADLDIRSHSGGMTLNIGKDSVLNARLQTGSGSAHIVLPPASAAHVEVRQRGSGSVRVASRLTLVDDLNDDEKKTGIWESAGFGSADHRITLTITDMGSGSIDVQ